MPKLCTTVRMTLDGDQSELLAEANEQAAAIVERSGVE